MHPEFAELVTHEAMTRIKQERVPFKILDAVDEFADFMKSKNLQLDDKRFENKYKQKYEFDLRKDSLNYYATVRSKADKERGSINQ